MFHYVFVIYIYTHKRYFRKNNPRIIEENVVTNQTLFKLVVLFPTCMLGSPGQ